jgi:hypothetical protein
MQLTGKDQQAFLSDPHQMNSTSYGRDNPITNKDQNGDAISQAAEIFYKILYANGVRETGTRRAFPWFESYQAASASM